MSRFNLDFRESNPKFLSPNSFLTMAEITPTTSLVEEAPETSENPTQSSLFPKWELYANLTLCILMHHQQRSHVRSSLSYWQAIFSGRAKQRKGR